MSKALLLLHGFLTCTDDWDELLPRLQPLYDEVVLFKQPGHERKGEKHIITILRSRRYLKLWISR